MEKHRSLIVAMAFVAATLTLACHKSETTETASSDTSVTTATETAATDTATTTSPSTVDTAGTASTSSASSTPLSDDDRKFAEKAAIGEVAEVSLGSSVSAKAVNADAKSFADRMVTDHSKGNDELKQIASAKGLTLPAEPDAEHKKIADKILAAKNVDKAYMDDMAKDHDEDVKEFEKASTTVKDADLKAWVDKMLPVLKEHQKMAHDIAGKLK